MENKIYNDDVERIVNEPAKRAVIESFHKKMQEKKRRKMLIDAVVYASIALASGLLGVIGWMIPLIAFTVLTACGAYATFCFGRFFENGKCWGWK